MTGPVFAEDWIRPDGKGDVIIGDASPVPAEDLPQIVAWIYKAAGAPDPVRDAVLDEVKNLIIGQQIADAGRLCDQEIHNPVGACSNTCKGRTCHSLEAHAAHNRVLFLLADLRST